VLYARLRWCVLKCMGLVLVVNDAPMMRAERRLSDDD